MAERRELQCLGCAARVFADDVAQKLEHEGPECEAFKELIARNASANPHVDDPQMVDEARENAEIDWLLRNGSGNEYIANASDFGFQTIEPRAAVRFVLREMRARGYKIRLPTSRPFGIWKKCRGCGKPIAFYPDGMPPHIPPGGVGHSKPIGLAGRKGTVPCELYRRSSPEQLTALHLDDPEIEAPTSMKPVLG